MNDHNQKGEAIGLFAAKPRDVPYCDVLDNEGGHHLTGQNL